MWGWARRGLAAQNGDLRPLRWAVGPTRTVSEDGTSTPGAGLGESGQVMTLSLSTNSKEDTRGQGEAMGLQQ